MTDITQIYSLSFIPILDWTILKDEKDRNDLYEIFKVDLKYQIIATDIIGDIIALFENKIYLINHEEPMDEPLLLFDNLSNFKELVLELIKIPDFSEKTPIKILKSTKSNLTKLKRSLNKRLKYLLEDTIHELTDLISDWDFYQTKEGKRFLITESFKNEFYKRINRPTRYKHVEVQRDFETEIIKISGFCVNETENRDELQLVLSSIECVMEVIFSNFYSFKEYQDLLKLKNG